MVVGAEHWRHTEELHGSLRLFPSNVVFRQLSSWGHWIRMHLQGKNNSMLLNLTKGVQSKTQEWWAVTNASRRECENADTPFDLAQLAMTREKWKTRVCAAAQAVEDQQYEIISATRQRLANKNASKSSTNE